MKPKILVLTSTFPRWKKDVEPPFVFELCRRLKCDFHVHVLAPHAPGAAKEETLDGVHVTRFRYFFSPWQRLCYDGGILANLQRNRIRLCLIPFFLFVQWIAFIRLLRKHSFDCIHAHWLIPQGMLAIIASLFIKIPPLLCTSHGGDLYGLRGRLFDHLKRFVAMQSGAVTVVSRAMKRDLSQLGVDPGKVRVIPMGVDLRRLFIPPVERSGRPTLLFVGRLVQKKGVRFLIQAMPTIRQKHPQVSLTIVGSGQDEFELQNMVKKFGIGSSVHFLGSMDNKLLPLIYQKAEMVIFPSVVSSDGDQEGFGLVLVEALGCGCATIVTDLPAMRDIIEHEKNCLVVPQKSPKAISEAVCHLLENPTLRRRLGHEGRRRVLQNFDWQLIADKYRDMIHILIKQQNEGN